MWSYLHIPPREYVGSPLDADAGSPLQQVHATREVEAQVWPPQQHHVGTGDVRLEPVETPYPLDVANLSTENLQRAALQVMHGRDLSLLSVSVLRHEVESRLGLGRNALHARRFEISAFARKATSRMQPSQTRP